MHLGASVDYGNALIWAKARCDPRAPGSTQEMDAYLSWLSQRTSNILTRSWGAVVALAKAIEGGETLSMRQAVKIMKEGQRTHRVAYRDGELEIGNARLE